MLLGLAATAATASCSSPEAPATPAPGATPSGGSVPGRPAATSPGAATTPAPAARADPPAILRTAGPDITSGSRSTPQVALTFHGQGDLAITRRVLDLCRAHQARVTVFAVGKWLDASPEIAREIVDAGHDLGNHTWSHPTLTALNADQTATEIAKGADVIRRLVGDPGLLFRPSGTPHSTDLIRAAATRSGYARTISYDVDPEDYRDPGAAAVLSRTLAAVQPGSIVSLHLGHQGTADALAAIFDGLAGRSLLPTTVTELLRSA